MIKIHLLCFFLVVFLSFSCNQPSKDKVYFDKIDQSYFHYDTIVFDYGEAIVPFRFRNVVMANNKMYLLNMKPVEIHVLSEEKGLIEKYELPNDGPGSMQYPEYMSIMDDSLLVLIDYNKIVLLNLEFKLQKEYFIDQIDDKRRNPFVVFRQDSLTVVHNSFFNGYSYNIQTSNRFIIPSATAFSKLFRDENVFVKDSTYFFELDFSNHNSQLISTAWDAISWEYQHQLLRTSQFIAQSPSKQEFSLMGDDLLVYANIRSADFYVYDFKLDSSWKVEVKPAQAFGNHPILKEFDVDYLDEENEQYVHSHYIRLMPFYYGFYYDKENKLLYRPYTLERKKYQKPNKMQMMVFNDDFQKIGDFPLFNETDELEIKSFDWADDDGLYFRIDPETYEDQLKFVKMSLKVN